MAQVFEPDASGEASGDAFGVVPPEPPWPLPSAGQSPFGRAVDGASVAAGWVADGCVVVALGDGEADGSAADTTAAPPRTRSPSAIVPTTIPRRNPPIFIGAGGVA